MGQSFNYLTRYMLLFFQSDSSVILSFHSSGKAEIKMETFNTESLESGN